MHSNPSANQIAGLNDNALEQVSKMLGQMGLSGKHILDIGCGGFPYLTPFLNIARISLWDKQISTKEEIVRVNFLQEEVPPGSEKAFDVIILSTVLHELYLQWNLNRLCSTIANREEGDGVHCFFNRLFESLDFLLKPGGSILIAENYHPRILSDEALLITQKDQLENCGHADSPASFIEPAIIVENAIRNNFRFDIMKDVRCVSDENISNSKKWKAESQFILRNRRVAILVFKKPENEDKSLLKKTFETSEVEYEKFAGLHSVLNKWTFQQKNEIAGLREEYDGVFWKADNSLWKKLVGICVSETKKFFCESSITLPSFQSFWISIWSVIFNERYLSKGGTHEHYLPIIWTKPDMFSHERDCWNSIAYNYILSSKKSKDFIGKNDIPSFYKYIRENSQIKSLTITYQRDFDLQNNLDEQEDALNSVEMSLRDVAHALYIVEFADDDLCYCGKMLDSIMGHKYCENNKFKIYLVSAYLDFLFLRRLVKPENDTIESIKNLIVEYNERWSSFIAKDSEMTAEQLLNFNSVIKQACDIGANWITNINCLPKAFITFSPSSFLGSVDDSMNPEEKEAPGNVMIVTDKIHHPKLLDKISQEIKYCFDAVRTIEMKWKMEKHQIKERREAIKSALAAIMARNMSHNIGSHVLIRLSQESLRGNIDSGRDAQSNSAAGKTVFDPMGLVIEDAYKALGTAGISDDFTRHRIGAAIHYLEAVHDQVDPNARPGKTRQEALAQDVRVLSTYVQQRMDFIAQISTDWAKWTTTSCLCHDVMALFFQQSKLLEHIAASENLTAARFDRDGKLLPKPKEKDKEGKPTDKDAAGRIKFVMRYLKPNANKKDFDVNVILDFDKPDEIKPVRIPVSFPGGKIGWQAFYIIIEGVIRNFAKHSYKSERHKDLQIVVDVIDYADETENSHVLVVVDGQDKPVKKPAYTVRIYSNVSTDDPNKEDKTVAEILQGNLGDSFIKSDGELNKQNWGLAEIRASVGYLQQATIMDIGENKFVDADEKKGRKIVNVKSCAETSPPLHDFGDEKTHFYYEFKILKPQIIGIETERKTDGCDEFVENKDRQNEGWRVFNSSKNAGISRSFDYYIVDGRDNTGTVFGKMLAAELKKKKTISKKKGNAELNETIRQELEKYPGRLFLICDKKDEVKPRTDQHQQLARVCVLGITDYIRLRHGYYEFNSDELENAQRKNGEKRFTENDINKLLAEEQNHGTDSAAQFLQKKWLEHWLKYRVEQERRRSETPGSSAKKIKDIADEIEKTPFQLSLYHYLNEGESSGGETPYIPDTTPYLPEKEKPSGTNLIPIDFVAKTDKTPERFAFVFGRHYGTLDSKSTPLKFRTEGRENIGYQGQNNLYGESMSGASSYYAFAQEEFKQGKETRDLLSLVEAALMRVVIIDERLQEGFNKASEKTLISTAEQQVFIGYLNSTNSLSQKPPSEAMKKSGYVTVEVDQTNMSAVKGIKLNRTLPVDEKTTKLLWQQEGEFFPDMLLLHQGILDHWVEHDHDKDGKIKEIIASLKTRIPFVVITSGRGRPTQVPDDCLFLPLSSFDPSPRNSMYEKFPLVQQVLSVVEINKK